MKTQRGFTLFEVAFALIVGGLVLGTATTMFLSYTKKNEQLTTQRRMEIIDDAIQLYLGIKGFYPCAAPPAARVDTATFGKSDCAAGTINVPGVSGPTDMVQIGAVPVRTLNLPDEFAADSWGNRFVYAVTTAFTRPDTTSNPLDDGDSEIEMNFGAVGVIGRNGLPICGASVCGPGGGSHYVLSSNGANRSGAWPLDGGTQAACPASGLERENCDNNATFRQAPIISARDNTQVFDDIVIARRLDGGSLFNNTYPRNAVVSFNLNACPEGWIPFNNLAGRIPLGAGTVAGPSGPTQLANGTTGLLGTGATGADTNLLYLPLTYCRKS